jgi:hypothetical protein
MVSPTELRQQIVSKLKASKYSLDKDDDDDDEEQHQQ